MQSDKLFIVNDKKMIKNMKKGISAIIATILMLLIAVALAGSAYMYASGMLTGKTAKTISISDLSCTNNKITIVVSNDGTINITNTADSGDIKFFVDNTDDTVDFDENGIEGDINFTIAPHETRVFVSDNGGSNYDAGTHTVLVTSPSNSVRQTVYC